MIHQYQRQHGFGNRGGANTDTRVMTAFGDHLNRLTRFVDAAARNAEAGGGFKGHRHQNILTAGDTAEGAPGIIRQKTFRRDFITVLAAFLSHGVKASTDFNPFNRVDTHHRMGDIGINTIKNRLAQTGWHVAGNHIDTGTDRVTFKGLHIVFQSLFFIRIRAEEGAVVDVVPVNLVDFDRAQLGQVTLNFYAVTFAQVLFSNATGSHTHCRFTGRRAAAATVVANSVFLVIGVVRMGRAELIHDIAVILGALIDIFDHHANRRAGGFTLENARQNFDLVGFLTLGDKTGLTRLATVQIVLQIGFAQFQSRRATVDDATDCRPVAFTKSGDSEQFSKGVTRHSSSESRL